MGIHEFKFLRSMVENESDTRKFLSLERSECTLLNALAHELSPGLIYH